MDAPALCSETCHADPQAAREPPELRFEGRARVGPGVEVDVPERDGHGDREEQEGSDDRTEPPSAIR